MIDTLINSVQVLIGFYFLGELGRQNPKIDSLISSMEKGYGTFNSQLKDTSIMEGVRSVQRFYGWIALASVALFFAMQKLLGTSALAVGVLAYFGLLSGLGWFSIRWCLDHSKAVQKSGMELAFIALSPLLMGVVDLLCQTPFTQMMVTPLYSLPVPPDWPTLNLSHPLVIGGVFSVLFATLFGIYYFVLWALAVPTVFVSVALIAVPVLLARFIHTLAPQKPLVGFFFLMWALLTFVPQWVG